MADTRPVSRLESEFITERFLLRGTQLFRLVPVGRITGKNRYVQIHITTSQGHRRLLSHRIIFFLKTGRWPKMVDHHDGDTRNNHPKNLRACTRYQSIWNRKIQNRKQADMPIGVCRFRDHYHAYIRYKGKQVTKHFRNFKLACRWRKKMERKLFKNFAVSRRPIKVREPR